MTNEDVFLDMCERHNGLDITVAEKYELRLIIAKTIMDNLKSTSEMLGTFRLYMRHDINMDDCMTSLSKMVTEGMKGIRGLIRKEVKIG